MRSTCGQSESVVPVQGGTLFVKSWTPSGEKSGEAPIVLIHESLGCVEGWKEFPEKLCENLNRVVIAYDRLGFGKSSARTDQPTIHFIQEEVETYLPSVVKSLGLKRVVVLGHSVGGAMAVAFAATHPEICEAVITESAQAFIEERTRRMIQLAQFFFQRPETFAKLVKLHGEKTQWVLDAWTQVWLSPEFEGWNLRNELPNLRCPLLALHGDRDEFGSTAFPDLLCELSGAASTKHLLANCGHVPHREHPDLVLGFIGDFLNRGL